MTRSVSKITHSQGQEFENDEFNTFHIDAQMLPILYGDSRPDLVVDCRR